MVLLNKGNNINRRITNKNKLLSTIVAGIVFLILPILIIFIDPIHVIVKYKLRLAKGSLLYELLQHEIPAARLSVYVFNITNADRFLSGEDYKLKVEEVGPFVYQEYRWYEDLEEIDGGKLMGMTPKIRSEFVPEASIAHPKDVNLTLPNLPLLSSTSMLANYPSFIHYAFNIMVAQLGTKVIMNMDVHNYLWGYDNPLVTICNSLAPGLVYFESFGLLDRLYDNESDYRLVVGATDQDRFKIKSVKKYRHIKMGTIEDVEESELTFEDTYEGMGYPPMLTPDIPINMYRLGVCKTFNLKYTGSRIMDYGGEALVYTMSNKTFIGDVNPITLKEYPYGLMDISKCYYGLPFVFSKGHFVEADPKLLDRIDGLKPNRSVHVNEFVIDRKASVTFDTKMSLHLSMMVDDVSFNRGTKMFTNSVIPVVHVIVDQPKMSDSTMSKFVLVYTTAPYIVLSIIIVQSLIGFGFLGYAARLIYLSKISSSNGMVFEGTLDRRIKNVEMPLIEK